MTMKIKNSENKAAALLISLLILSGCSLLETKEDLFLTEEMLTTQRNQMFSMGYKAYSYIPNGFIAIDNNLFAAVSDEAEYVTSTSQTQKFNDGTWNQFYNPNDLYANYYCAIHDIYFYLENSKEYKRILGENRDTLSTNGKTDYYLDIMDVKHLRAEMHILNAYYCFELFKRFGAVPIVKGLFNETDEANLPRNAVDEVVEHIVSEIDSFKNELVIDWAAEGLVGKTGRITLGAALAIKARALLYAASPQFNKENSQIKWERAARAANDIIALGIYNLDASYRGLFITNASNTSIETIWGVKSGQTNQFERNNYPIGTPGGNTGISPSQNLVRSYEYKGEITGDIYENLDPRFYASILKNGDLWNGRTLEIYINGTDDPQNKNASPTGYYLKKFLNENLNLTDDAREIRTWIAYRYGEVLLNFAEAINEAYGPDQNNGLPMTAREAVNAIRSRSDVNMPFVTVASGDKDGMRKAIKHERQIELAFEDHRYWDLRRWDDAKVILNLPIKGVTVTKIDSVTYSYDTTQLVSPRVFLPEMNLFPIPEYAIINSKGVINQNEGW